MNIFQKLFRMLIGNDVENQQAIYIIGNTLNRLVKERGLLIINSKKKNITEREKWRWKFVISLYSQKIFDYSWVLETLGAKLKYKNKKTKIGFNDYGLGFSSFVEMWKPYFKKLLTKKTIKEANL